MQLAAVCDPFDPLESGPPEPEWRRLLCDSPVWMPGAGALLIVAPHPDDEVLGAGGLMHTWASGRSEVRVLSVTDGEAAYPDWDGLGAVRRGELDEALGVLSPAPVSVTHLGLPDGRIKHYASRLRRELVSLCDADTTLIAPYELDGHPDHEAVGRVCVELAHAWGMPLARYPIWSWHRRAPRALRDVRWGRFPLSQSARRAKALAVSCFRSQVNPRGRNPILPRGVLRHFDRRFEAFIL
jgi:LmbE family N-acetylglucosaminyl deacetylase